MQDIEQNMEELFRKAADHYPLKVNDSQWDDIAPALLNEPVNTPATKKRRFRKYTGLLLLFLFLLINDGIIINTLRNNKSRSFVPPPVENKINNAGIEKKEPVNNYDKHNESKLQSETYYPLQYAIEKKSTTTAMYLINKIDQKPTSSFKNQAEKSNQSPTFPVIQLNILSTISKPDIVRAIPSAIKPETFPAGTKTTDEKDEPRQKENQEPAKKDVGKKETYHSSGLYMGAMAGPLFDEVKNQGLKKTGFSIGIIAGYKFKKQLSVETGFLFAKKPYYSTGKYFNMDKISGSMPQAMKILSLEGNNFVWEIPVRMKYDFLYSNKSNFFSSAGITSYIMTHEKNNYLVAMNGAQQTMISSYKNKSRSLAATLDISAGYEHKIGKSNYFRIEPYIQIPLKGMGVGSMQMISTGLRIGITKFTN